MKARCGWTLPLGVRPKTHPKPLSGLSGLVAPHPRLKTKSLAFSVVNDSPRRGSDFYTRSTESIFDPKRSRLFITCVVYISNLREL